MVLALRLAYWLAASFLVSWALLDLVSGGRGAFVWYVIYWCVIFLPIHGTALAVWALVDRRAHSIETNRLRMAAGLLVVAVLPATLLLFVVDDDLAEGLGLGVVQWLGLLLPRLVLPFLQPRVFRTEQKNPFADAASAEAAMREDSTPDARKP